MTSAIGSVSRLDSVVLSYCRIEGFAPYRALSGQGPPFPRLLPDEWNRDLVTTQFPRFRLKGW